VANKVKTARVIKPYVVNNYHGYRFTVPVGARVTNMTACGTDDNYRFWQDFHKVAEDASGFRDSLLHHDLTYYGLNIPAEYCSEWMSASEAVWKIDEVTKSDAEVAGKL
jgi:hypothetical protein